MADTGCTITMTSGPVDHAGLFAQVRVKIASRLNQMADERDKVADEREALADQRERAADGREALADQRERAADDRETRLNEREVQLDLATKSRTLLGHDVQERVEATIALYVESKARAGAATERAEAARQRYEASRRRYEASRRRYEASRRRTLTGAACAYAELGSEMAVSVADRGQDQRETLARARDAVARSRSLRASGRTTGRAGGAGRAAP